jgi:hypothetical protein
VEVVGALIAGNSRERPGVYDGIAVGADPVKGAGQRVRIRGGTIDGADADDVTGDAAFDTFPEPTQRSAIYLAAGADDILIDHVTMPHGIDGPPPIRCDMNDGAHLLVHHGTVDTAMGVGGPGSTLVVGGRLYVKATPLSRRDGWEPLQSIAAGPAAERPDRPAVGQMYFDTDRDRPLWWNGTAWVDAAGR